MKMTASPIALSPPVRILLYVAIPGYLYNVPHERSGVALLRNRVRRALNLAEWCLFRRWRAHYSTFEDAGQSNRGDVAIREGLRQELTRAFAPRAVEFIEVAWSDLAKALALQPVDLIVLGGSGYIHPDATGRLPQRVLRDLQVLERTSVPAVAISIGFNSSIINVSRGSSAPTSSSPSLADDQNAALRRLFDRLALASMRDENSRTAVAAAVSSAPPVVVDPAYLLVHTIGVAPAKVAGHLPAIGVNVAFHGQLASDMSHSFLPTFVEALKRFQARTPCRFVYFVHSDGERGVAKALQLAGIALQVVHGPIEQMINAYRGLDAHVCQMLHSAIFATGVGVPTLCLAYDVKSVGFFKLLGLDDFCVNAGDLNAEGIAASLDNLIANRASAAAKIAAVTPHLISAAHAFYRKIPAVLNQKASAADIQMGSACDQSQAVAL